MLRRKGRPKESETIKLNPPNVILPQIQSVGGKTDLAVTPTIKYKCDVPRCPSEAVVHINARYCKLCAQDKGFSVDG